MVYSCSIVFSPVIYFVKLRKQPSRFASVSAFRCYLAVASILVGSHREEQSSASWPFRRENLVASNKTALSVFSQPAEANFSAYLIYISPRNIFREQMLRMHFIVYIPRVYRVSTLSCLVEAIYDENVRFLLSDRRINIAPLNNVLRRARRFVTI